MTKPIIIFICSFFLISPIKSQISINSNTLPEVGDILKIINSRDANVDVGEKGPDKVWDFSMLKGGLLHQHFYYDLDDEDKISADFKCNIDNQTLFYNVDNIGVHEIGVKGGDPYLGLSKKLIKYNQQKLVRPLNINYGDTYQFNYYFDIVVNKNELHDSIIGILPIIADSIKFSVSVHAFLEVDAWGKIIIQTGNYFNVLRMKEVQNFSASLYYKLNNEWIQLDSELRGPFGDKMRNYKIVKYNFLNNISKEPIAIVCEYGDDEFQKIVYKDFDSALIFPEDSEGKRDIFIHPNPSFGIFNTVFLNVEPGDYTIVISNIIGKKLWKKIYHLDKSGIFKEDLSYLSKGPYLYMVTGPKGDRLVARKITILKP